jgi:hypothetical protein
MTAGSSSFNVQRSSSCHPRENRTEYFWYYLVDLFLCLRRAPLHHVFVSYPESVSHLPHVLFNIVTQTPPGLRHFEYAYPNLVVLPS